MAVLFLGIEDRSGLWEILLEQDFYELPESDRLDLARRVVEELAVAGFVSLYRCREPDGPREEISKEYWDEVLSTAQYWQLPAQRAVAIRFKTTPEGKTAYWEAEAR